MSTRCRVDDISPGRRPTPSLVLRAAVLELAGPLAVGDMVPPLLPRTPGHATIAQVRSGHLGNTTLIENRKDVPRLLTVTDSSATHISRSELLMLLEGLHEKLNACFEDLRRLPQATTRFEARHRQSTSSEWAGFR
jgi:hypothetical protein